MPVLARGAISEAKVKGGFFYVLHSKLLHMPPQIHCVGGWWDRTQGWGFGNGNADALTIRLDLIPCSCSTILSLYYLYAIKMFSHSHPNVHFCGGWRELEGCWGREGWMCCCWNRGCYCCCTQAGGYCPCWLEHQAVAVVGQTTARSTAHLHTRSMYRQTPIFPHPFFIKQCFSLKY